jgi:cell division inhibitor SulA/protein ImuA
MPEVAAHPQLEALLQHPSLWRGRGAAPMAGWPTGFAALDAVLPGGGWPQRGVVEILIPGSGCGELTLWAPLVRQLTGAATARWCTFVAPPFEPFAPAWRAQGARLDRLLIVRAPQPLWALEQSLLSGACALGFAWPQQANMTQLRRLALAGERGASLAVLIRPLRAALEHSTAVLRMALTRTATHLRLQLLKGRGLTPCVVELEQALLWS